MHGQQNINISRLETYQKPVDLLLQKLEITRQKIILTFFGLESDKKLFKTKNERT
jgi:hypothetical protein